MRVNFMPDGIAVYDRSEIPGTLLSPPAAAISSNCIAAPSGQLDGLIQQNRYKSTVAEVAGTQCNMLQIHQF